MYEDDIEYASRRLNNTLVRKADGVPFYIISTYYNSAGVMTHTGTNIFTNSNEEVFHRDIDLEPVPLGFVNTTSDMVFVARKPMRKDWRQGLSRNSIITYGAYRPEDIKMKWLIQPILKQYPSFTRALRGLDKKASVAFSRDFGLTQKGSELLLVYHQHVVGSVTKQLPSLHLSKMFLQQHLEEAMGT